MKNKGFSLVELIVVIAIMAILVGVAVPVYTSYISKAQKNKDIQMVDEIKHAVEIAAIGDKWYESLTGENKTGIGMIVIKENGTTVVPTTNTSVVDLSDLIKDAMEATFGATYRADIKLSYDEWKGVLSADGAMAINSSAYVTNVTDLLDAVQNVTTMFSDVVSGSDAVSLTQEMKDFMTENGFDWSNPTELANGMVVYIADKSVVDTDTKINVSEFKTAWYNWDFSDKDTIGLDSFTKKAAEYAFVQAMATRGCDVLKADFAEYIKPATDGSFQGANPMQLFNTHTASCDCCNAITEAEHFADAEAYLAILNQVHDSKDLVAQNASNKELYTNSDLTQLVTSYISVAELVGGTGAEDGDVVIVVTLSNTGVVAVDTYPIDY